MLKKMFIPYPFFLGFLINRQKGYFQNKSSLSQNKTANINYF